MRIVVTGGTGFIGGHLLEALAARGDEVVSIERPGANRRWIAHLPLTVRATGLTNEAVLAAACDGADAVFHLAGRTRARSAAEYHDANVEGTAAVLRAAAASARQVPHVIVASSFSAVGPVRNGQVLGAHSTPFPLSRYGESKLRAEAVVHAWSDRVPATIVRPTSVYGPREGGVLLFFRMVQRGYALAIDWEQRVQLIHIADLVRLFLQVADTPHSAGRTWCVANPDIITWRRFAETVGRALGRSPRLLRVPQPMAGLVARTAELSARLRGRAASLNRDRVRELANDWVCDAERAWSDLGLRPEVPLEQGVASTAEWYREAGWL